MKSTKANAPVTVSFNGAELKVMDAKAAFKPAKGDRNLKLRIFLDRSVIEVFANETVCVTKVISPLDPNASLEIRVEGGHADAKRVEAWPMKTIW
jgi:beta-fructofuranosidase